jgi:hypothetical protein
MRNKVVFFSLFISLCLSCATVKDLERKKEAGDYSHAELYEYNWEAVYDAMAFVWYRSENFWLYTTARFDYAREEKRVVLWTHGGCLGPITPPSILIAYFFEPQGESKTRVLFVIPLSSIGWKTMIHHLNHETHYYLDHGKDAYLKYTNA